MSDVIVDTPAPAPPSQQLAAEAVGTAVLVVIGLGAPILAESGDGGAFGFGLALFALMVAFAGISGGRFNPAVSIGAAMSGRLAWKDAGLQAAAQIGGGIVGGILILLIVLTSGGTYDFGDDGPLRAPGFGDRGDYDLFGALLLELIVAFVFVLVVLAVTDERSTHRLFAPLAVGLLYVGVGFVTLGATGSVVNPAVALSTVFFSGGDAIVQAWLFVLVPLVGAALAGLLHPVLFGRVDEPVAGSGLSFASSGSSAQGYPQQQWGQPQPGGYAPQHGYPVAAAAAPAPAPVEQPIIQDGWQWDPQAQQWIPAQQAPPQQPQAPSWPTPDEGSQTQVRPPDGF